MQDIPLDLDIASPGHLVLDEFLPIDVARDLRAGIDRHFAEPQIHRAETHQIWNYWHIPDLYTYLRTQPNKILPAEALRLFHNALTAYAADHFALDAVSWPFLSLYVGGCRQGLHNDSANGRLGFVYSLTKPGRRSTGGETLIMRETDYFTEQLHRPNAGRGLYELIEPNFNRLLLFDDRLLHAVPIVEGTMEPGEGRFVLHGHVKEGAPIVRGALGRAQILPAIAAWIEQLFRGLGADPRRYHGPLSLRVSVDARGGVTSAAILFNRVYRLDRDAPPVATIVKRTLDHLAELRFPPASGASEIRFPILFGGVLAG